MIGLYNFRCKFLLQFFVMFSFLFFFVHSFHANYCCCMSSVVVFYRSRSCRCDGRLLTEFPDVVDTRCAIGRLCRFLLMLHLVVLSELLRFMLFVRYLLYSECYEFSCRNANCFFCCFILLAMKSIPVM